MSYKVGRVFFALLVGALLTAPVFPQQDTQKQDAPKPLTAAEKKQQEQDKKKAEQARKQQDKIDKELAKKHADVDNIGNRDINKGIGNINFTSLDKEIALGKSLAAQVEQQVKLVDDPMITEYVNRVGQNLVRNSDAKVPFTIKVIESDEVNAFALPGGFFYLNTGVIAAADDESEMAAVMAHEIAHVAARHGTENAAKGTLLNLGTIPLIFVGGPAGVGIRQAAGLTAVTGFLHFSRKDETEADYLGVQYLWRTGYDPGAAVSFFEKLQAKEKARSGTMNAMFRDHPPTGDRVEKTKLTIEKYLPDKEEYVVTTSEFQKIKTQLALLEDRGLAKSEKDRAPSLRRRSPGSRPGDPDDRDSDKTSSTKPEDREPDADDRPTLKRKN